MLHTERECATRFRPICEGGDRSTAERRTDLDCNRPTLYREPRAGVRFVLLLELSAADSSGIVEDFDRTTRYRLPVERYHRRRSRFSCGNRQSDCPSRTSIRSVAIRSGESTCRWSGIEPRLTGCEHDVSGHVRTRSVGRGPCSTMSRCLRIAESSRCHDVRNECDAVRPDEPNAELPPMGRRRGCERRKWRSGPRRRHSR